ncbi:MAG: 50S ribosomal protein L19e [Candidatus Korarchaeum sp.]
MDLEYQRRLAARVAGVGLSRVRINPEKVEAVSEAVTRDDIKRLIRSGAIEILQKRGVSRVRGRRKRRGPGSRKGGKYSRLPRKERWVRRIRALRRELRKMRDEGMIDAKTYRELYEKLHTFNSVSQLRAHVTRG